MKHNLICGLYLLGPLKTYFSMKYKNNLNQDSNGL
jgi:hypothetical protein